MSRQATLEREAARVSAWIASVWSNRDPSDPTQKRIVLVIRNASDAAIHDVQAVAVMAGEECTFSALVCPPGESFARWRPPGKKWTWEFLASVKELERTDCTAQPFTKSSDWMLRSLRFTDALGARWEYTTGTGVHRTT